MKEGWEIKTLKEICKNITDGSHNPPKGVENSNYVMLSSQNVQNGYLDMTKVRYLSESDYKVEDARTNAKKGDVLLTIVGTIGRTCVLKGDEGNITFQRSVAILTPKEDINSYFLMYCFFSLNTFLNNEAAGAAQKGVYLKQLSRIPIPVPPLSEQQRIVDILDKEFEKIDRLKSNAERNLQHAKDLFQAALKSTFKNHAYWKWDKIGNVCKTGAGGTPSKLHKEYYEGGTIPWLRSGEVCEKYIHSSEMFISESGYQNSSAKWFPENTVLVAMYGATAAQVGILKIKSTTNQAVCGIFPNDNFIPEFLYYSLLSSQKELVSKATGNAQPNISQVKIKETKIPIISLEEQQDVVSQIDSLDTKCQVLQDNYTKTIQLCDDLKQSLLRKAFNGEL